MIAQAGQKAPFALLPPSTADVEAAESTLFQFLNRSLARPHLHAEVGRYRMRLAQSAADREAACRLRFRVFNMELGEGLESSYDTGLDKDHLDVFCEHLLVENKDDGKIVGTYRMQTGLGARRIWDITRSRSSTSLHMSRCATTFWSWACSDRSRASYARGAYIVVARDCAVC